LAVIDHYRNNLATRAIPTEGFYAFIHLLDYEAVCVLRFFKEFNKDGL
jgi:hypothetical protein